jgi:TetR/AcrR family transcriptional regulator, transcriptional repressor for nem operon
MAPPPAWAEANRPKKSGRGLKMMSEVTADLPAGHPGCLVAAYCYQDRLFDREVRDLYTSAMLGWRRRFRERLELIVARYPPRIAVDLDHLADMLSAIAEGGIVVSKVIKDKRALSQQLMLYREFIRAVFLGT